MHPCQDAGRAPRLDRNSRRRLARELCAESYSERQLEELDDLTEPWLYDYERHRPPGSNQNWAISRKEQCRFVGRSRHQ
jgi:hypothetical protein